MKPHIVREKDAARIAEWLEKRGGIVIWPSHDLSDPGRSVTTPYLDPDGNVNGSPGWKYPSPSRHIADTADVVVSFDEPFKAFPVWVQVRGQFGQKGELTPASSRRVRRTKEEAGEGCFHIFGPDDNPLTLAAEAKGRGHDICTVYRQVRTVPLAEYLACAAR